LRALLLAQRGERLLAVGIPTALALTRLISTLLFERSE
jgi:hypothetical protein